MTTGTQIPNMTAATALTGAEQFEAVQSGVSVKVTGTQIATLAQAYQNQTPASAAATGTAGTIVWDSNFIYVCISQNVWKRVAITTW